MSDPFPYPYDPPITSLATAAVIPVDRFRRTEIRSGVTAELIDPANGRRLPFDVIRNRRGYLCLLDRPADTEYTFRLDPTAAGYLGPIDIRFNPSADGVQQIVWLDPKPDFDFAPEATLVRGSVVTSPAGEESPVGLVEAVVSLEGERFQTTTDHRGAFALPLELPSLVAGEPAEPVEVDLRFEHPDHGARVLTVTLTDGRSHVFAEPIALDSDNAPPFV